MLGKIYSRVFTCHLYFLLWCIYWLQGTLFTTGSLISQTILIVLLVISMYYFLLANIQYKLPPVLKTLSLIVLLLIFYGVFSIVSGDTFTIRESGISGVASVNYIKNILISILPIFYSFIAAKKRRITESSLKIWTFIFLVVTIVSFYDSQATTILLTDRDEITNNSAYSIIAIVVLIPLFDRNIFLQYLLFAVCMYFVIIGMKRGALVCGGVAMVWFLYTMFKKGKKTRYKIWTLLFTVLIISAVVYYVNIMLESSDYFNYRLQTTLEGNSSNRNTIYAELFNHFINESSPINFLFGNGANATLNISMNYAHNDWLEMAINNGLVMVILYLVYWIRMIKSVKNLKNDNIAYMILSLFFIIFFIKSFISMSYNDIPTWASVACGFALSRCYTTQNST